MFFLKIKWRVNQISETIPGSSALSTTFAYDGVGRLLTRTHPSAIVETMGYTNGYLSSVSAGGVTRWAATAVNAFGQVTNTDYGASLKGEFGYDGYGTPTNRKAKVGSTYKQDYRVVFNNATGNLTSRQDYLRSKLESFTYDTGLDRLLTVTGPQNLTMNYAANGNFSQKSDVGSVYTYGTTGKPYQLTGIETSTGLVSDVEQNIVYTSFEQPSTITETPYQALFTYNAGGERAKMEIKQSGATIKTRWYAGSRYIKETAGGVTKEFTWIGGDAYTAPCLAVTQSGTTTYYYLLRDHLGTITHVTDASGNVANEYSFDAWGRRRNFTDWNYTVAAQTDILPDRGFTGHEYLPWFNLYNMNGRLYDPVVGRFLEPDPIVQDATSTQNLNRYSYALNNPLKYIDPSGYKMLEYLSDTYDYEGGGFWYRGDYYYQNGNGNWTGSYSGKSPYGGTPGGSTYGIGTGDAGPGYVEWASNKAYKESLGAGNQWIQLGFFYYDSQGNPVTKNGVNGVFWIYETSPFEATNNIPAGGGNLQGDRDWLNKTHIGLESYALSNSSKEQLFKLAAKTDASINNLKYVKGVKVVGKTLVVGGIAVTGYQVYDDVFNKGNYYSAGTRAAVLGIGLAATTIPVAGWAVAGGIGLVDAIWGDQFYNWVELNLRKEP